MIRTVRPISWLAILSLVVSNIIPVLGVLYWAWDLFQLMILYLGELLILTAASYAKLVKVTHERWNDQIKNLVGLVVGASFVYFIFICVLFSKTIDPTNETIDLVALKNLGQQIQSVLREIAWPLTLIALSHLLSYIVNFLGRGEYLRLTPTDLTKLPGWRMIGIHLAILGGCFLGFNGEDPTRLAILILMSIKTLADLITHIGEHRQA